MNNSIKFILQRIKGNHCSDWIKEIDWNSKNIIVHNPIKILKSIYNISNEDLTNGYKVIFDKDKDTEHIVKIKYDNNVKFDYFRSEQSTHDGTFLFTFELFGKLFKSIIEGTSYLKDDEKDMNCFMKNPSNYEVIYTFGDLVMHNKYLDEKQKQTVVLPVKFDLIKIK